MKKLVKIFNKNKKMYKKKKKLNINKNKKKEFQIVKNNFGFKKLNLRN